MSLLSRFRRKEPQSPSIGHRISMSEGMASCETHEWVGTQAELQRHLSGKDLDKIEVKEPKANPALAAPPPVAAGDGSNDAMSTRIPMRDREGEVREAKERAARARTASHLTAMLDKEIDRRRFLKLAALGAGLGGAAAVVESKGGILKSIADALKKLWPMGSAKAAPGAGASGPTIGSTGDIDAKRIMGIRVASNFAPPGSSSPFPLSGLSGAVSDLGGNPGVVYVDSTIDVTANYTVPSNVHLLLSGASLLKPETGVTLTLNGPFEAPLSKVFSYVGTGVVAFGRGSVEYVVPEWWGADVSGGSDSYLAFQNGLKSIYSFGGKMVISSGFYLLSQPLVWDPTPYAGTPGAATVGFITSVSIEGEIPVQQQNTNLGGSTLVRGVVFAPTAAFPAGGYLIKINPSASAANRITINGVSIKNITLYGKINGIDTNATQAAGLLVQAPYACAIENVNVEFAIGDGIHCAEIGASDGNTANITNCEVFGASGWGIYDSVFESEVRGCAVTACGPSAFANGGSYYSANSTTISDSTADSSKGVNFWLHGHNSVLVGCKTFEATSQWDSVVIEGNNCVVVGNELADPGNSRGFLTISSGNVVFVGNALQLAVSGIQWIVNRSSTGNQPISLIEGNVLRITSPGTLPTNPIQDSATPNMVVKNNPGLNPQGVAAITVGASPFTYTNNDSVPEAIYIDGGTVSAIAKNAITVYTSTGHTVWLEPGEAVTVTYTVLPTMNKDRK